MAGLWSSECSPWPNQVCTDNDSVMFATAADQREFDQTVGTSLRCMWVNQNPKPIAPLEPEAWRTVGSSYKSPIT
jgi:hypothetical protein